MTQAQTSSAPTPPTKGLEGIVAGDSSKSRVDGTNGRLFYCGYPIEPLAEQGTFEECIYLLFNNELPTADQLASFKTDLAAQADVPGAIWDVLRPLAKTQTLMDLLRTGVSALSAFDDEVAATRESSEGREEIEQRIAMRLQARIGGIVAGAFRLQRGLDPVDAPQGQSLAAQFLTMLKGEAPSAGEERIFDAALTLHADHGFNASTFAAPRDRRHRGRHLRRRHLGHRLPGRSPARRREHARHADAREDRRGRQRPPPSSTTCWASPRTRHGLRPPRLQGRGPARHGAAPDGQGPHRPDGHTKWFEMSRVIEDRVKESKGIFPNVDFYSASVYGSLDLDPEVFTPIFAVSRASGWLAHVMEQHADNRLIRPRANYVGAPERDYVALTDR